MKAWRAFLAGPVTSLALRAGHLLVLALGVTWRVRHVGPEHVVQARGVRGSVLYVFTHGVLLPLSYTHRSRDIRVLISESRDGEIIARVVSRLGFGSVRGSSTRGGTRAVAEMVALAREGHDLAITPDGPRGPRGSVAPGTWITSSRGDLPVVPVGVAARPAWRARSWDRFLVPLPFASVWVVYGPAVLPSGEPAEETAARIAEEMAAAERQALGYAAGSPVPGGWGRVPA
jgi:lysophospholipid acyltransferase (LPLAT)-like uncharacterized protein